MGGKWLHSYGVPVDPVARLVCFPHAGGSAVAYRGWPQLLPGDVELLAVCYPGRHTRMAESPLTEMGELVDEVVEALEPYLDRPLALFGHSMGSAVAYETTLRLEKEFGVRPTRLSVSGRGAPHAVEPGRLHLADDATLIENIKGRGSATAELLSDDSLHDLFLPPLRADFQLLETYRPSGTERVDCPIDVYYGEQDPECTAEVLQAWSELGAAGVRFHRFPGGHFYLERYKEELVGQLAGWL